MWSGLHSSVTPKWPVQHPCTGIQHRSGQGEACTHLPALTIQIIPSHPVKLEPGSHTKPRIAARPGVCDKLWVRDAPSPLCAHFVIYKQDSNLCTHRGAMRRISQRLEICRSSTELHE